MKIIYACKHCNAVLDDETRGGYWDNGEQQLRGDP